MVKSFSLNDIATEHVRSVCARKRPAEALKLIHDAFHLDKEQFRQIAERCCMAMDEVIDVDDFGSALADAVNDECERQLDLLDVPEDLADAKDALRDSASWEDYAGDVMQSLRDIKAIADESQ